ncbi:MAG: hypothetical protein GY760_21280 [Deltaproteobacteria bacterium]|nr:hypothetical protein [Deltaproteobacteria bacterium]
MGLKCSHNAFTGTYSAFNRFRQIVAHSVGGSSPPHYIMNEDGSFFIKNDGLVKHEGLDENQFYFDNEIINEEDNPGFFIFMRHSDSEGNIAPDDCIKVADDLEKYVLPKADNYVAGGHLEGTGSVHEVTLKFIEGCRLAAKNGEYLEFG